MNYVVGLLFDPRQEYVILIEKQRPDWQKCKLNGPGGKINDGESPIDAMIREFEEETSVKTREKDWRVFAHLTLYDKIDQHRQVGSVQFFTATKNVNTRTMTDERVFSYFIGGTALSDLPVVNNLKWLIPVALDPQHPLIGWEEPE